MKHKNETFFKKTIYGVCFLFLISAFVFLGTRNYTVKKTPDNELFSREYRSISQDNLFLVLTSYETLTMLERGTGLLFLGFPQNEWSGVIAELLNQVSKEKNYPISYYNFYEDRNQKHDNYQGIVKEVDEYLHRNDVGKLDLYAPSVVAVVHGKVVYFDDETSFVLNKTNPKSYWTDPKKEEKLKTYREVIDMLQSEVNENEK